MGKTPIKMKAVVYALSPVPAEDHARTLEGSAGKNPPQGPRELDQRHAPPCASLSGVYTYVQTYQENEKLKHRFDYRTLQVLESAMASKDVKSLSLSRSSLKSVLRSSLYRLFSSSDTSLLRSRLSVLEFFVRAFSLAGDVEANHNAFILRELKSATCPWAQVSPYEWLTFASQSLDNSFFYQCCQGKEGCDYALSCLKKKDDENPSMIKKVVDNVEITRKVRNSETWLSHRHLSGSGSGCRLYEKENTEQQQQKEAVAQLILKHSL
ncbi:unnamed protein product [Rhodiola kirilowii]